MYANLIYSIGEDTITVQQIMQSLEFDDLALHGYTYRLVKSTNPAICMYHLLAGWLQGQIVVYSGTEDVREELAQTGTFVVVDSAPLHKVGNFKSYEKLIFPKPAHAAAAIVMSSGTTGKPKGILLSREAIEASCDVLVDVFKMRSDEIYGNLSVVHSIGALRAYLLALRYKSSIHFFTNAKLDGIQYVQAVLNSGCAVILTGASFVRLLHQTLRWLDFSDSKLRAIMSCGSLYDYQASYAIFQAKCIEVINAYGQTETSGIVMCEPLGSYRENKMPPVLKDITQHLRHVHTQVYEIGIESKKSYLGYLAQKPNTEPIIWTGDFVEKDGADLRFKGRLGHAIKTSSAIGWLFPELVENWLRQHGGVSDAAVRPLRDHSGLWCVVQSDSISPNLKTNLIAAVGKDYANIKIFAGTVTRSPAGKLKDMRAYDPLAPRFKDDI